MNTWLHVYHMFFAACVKMGPQTSPIVTLWPLQLVHWNGVKWRHCPLLCTPGYMYIMCFTCILCIVSMATSLYALNVYHEFSLHPLCLFLFSSLSQALGWMNKPPFVDIWCPIIASQVPLAVCCHTSWPPPFSPAEELKIIKIKNKLCVFSSSFFL